MSDHDTWNMFAARIIGGLFSKHGCGPTDHNMIEMAALVADALLAESKKRERPVEGARADADPVRDQLAAALSDLLRRDEINTCQHENTHRGGIIWTICDDCGAKFADDTNPWKPFVDPREWGAAYAALAAHRAPAEPTPPQPDDDGWIKHDGMTVPVEPCTIVDAQDADGFVWEDVIVGEDGCVRDVFWLWNTPRGEDVAPHLRIAKYRVSGSGRIVSEAGVTKGSQS